MKALLVLALLASPVATATLDPQQIVVLPDQLARAKFPGEDPAIIDTLAFLNRTVNHSITYASDRAHYGVREHFVSMPADGKGDCEDYALTKLELLSNAGFPIVGYAKLVMVAIRRGDSLTGHAILAVKLPKGTVMYLDMNSDEPMTRKELVRAHYHFFDWRA